MACEKRERGIEGKERTKQGIRRKLREVIGKDSKCIRTVAVTREKKEESRNGERAEKVERKDKKEKKTDRRRAG